MLPDRLTQLLTAYIDGELSARQRRSVLRLLKRSPAARQLFQQLRDDATRLRGLSRAHLSRNFPQRIVRAISDRPVCLPRHLPPVLRPAVPTWLGLASAAAVLLLIGISSYVFFAVNWDQASSVVESNGPRPEAPAPADAGNHGVTPKDVKRAEPVPRGPSVVVWAIERLGRWGSEEVARLGRDDGKRTPDTDPIATPGSAPGSFDIVNPRGLLLLNVRDLGMDKPRQQLHEELERGNACRLELFCLENAKGFGRLQAAFKAHGIRLMIDKDAQTCLNRRTKTSYVVYAEDLTAQELATILQEVGREDKKAESRHEGQFDRIIVNALSTADYKELSNLLGIDVKLLQAPSKMDPRRPISDKTAGEVIRVLEGQGPQRPVPGKPGAKATERTALVLASSLVRPRSASREIKLFLEGRRERRAGTVQMVLVLHGTKG